MKKFYIAYDTDVGIKKKTNQDSLLLKGCSEEHGETLLIAICDGMGGMEKGELASATVVRAFSDWFEQVYIKNEMHVGDEGIRQQWQSLLEEINGRLIRYGKENQIQMFGPLLGRFGKATIAKPGGDKIGRRRLDTHFLGFKYLGANFVHDVS